MPNLMWLFLIPFIASALLFIFPIEAKRVLKGIAVTLGFIPLLFLLSKHTDWIGSSIDYVWFPALSIAFHLRIDALSLVFLYLTALVIPIVLLSVNSQTLLFPRAFYGLILLLQGLLIGFFTARDLVFFTIFWEAMLLPLYFLINMWGGAQRHSAAIKFIVYMVAGSVLMTAAVLALYLISQTHGPATFNMDQLASVAKTTPYASLLAGIFLLAFAVKTPLFPFHAWLPDTYYQASTSGTILLSALLSKAGIYGILRVGLGLFPEVLKAWSPWLLGLAIAGVFYGGLAAWRQSDFKRLLAYSSFSHVNFILVGLFIWNPLAQEGAILQALNHGITITALFLVSGWLESRLHSTGIGSARGLARYLPKLCWLTLFFVLSSVALPGTNNFVGELLIFFALFNEHPWLTGFLGLTIILSVIYMLRWMQKVYFDEPSPFRSDWIDLSNKEMALAMPLVALILWIGLYPMAVLKHLEPNTEQNTTVAMQAIAEEMQ